MKKEIFKQPNQVLKERRAALKEQIITFGTSDRFTLAYAITAVSLGSIYIIRLISGNSYNRIIEGGIECIVIWLASYRYYCLKMIYPESRTVRWWFYILIVAGIISAFSFVMGWPGPRFLR